MKKTEVDGYATIKKEIRGFDYRFRRKHEWNGSSTVCGMDYPQCVEWTIHCLWNGLSTVCGTDYPLSTVRSSFCFVSWTIIIAYSGVCAVKCRYR
ncbi:MAG: hypothetical protein IJ828_06385, partial [Treponema sp.]|nr:hypothetical protein [Treponema sp.]